MTEFEAWAKFYAAQGQPVFPIARAGKRPLTRRGHLDASTDIAQIIAWCNAAGADEMNIGGPVLDGTLIVDVDVRNGGLDSLPELQAKGLPATRHVVTGGGGYHLWYSSPTGLAWPRTLAKGIDLQSLGKYVVLPPSLHESGNRYNWTDPAAPIAAAPDWLVALGKPRGAAGVYEAGQDSDEDTPGFAEKVPHATELLVPFFALGIRHHFSFACGGYLKNRGYSSSDAELLVGKLAEAAGSSDPEARAADAARAWRYAEPAGYSRLVEWVPPSVMDRLGALLPDLVAERRKAEASLLGAIAAQVAPRVETDPALVHVYAPPPTQTYTIPAAAVPPALSSGEPSVFLETIGRAEIERLIKSLGSNKRSDEDRVRGRALKRILNGMSYSDDIVLAERIAIGLAKDIGKQYPHAAYDPSLLASGLDRNGINQAAFVAALVEQQAYSREVLARNKMTGERRKAAGLLLDEAGNPKNTLGNVVAILTSDENWEGVLRFDTLNAKIMVFNKPPIEHEPGCSWTDVHTTRARIWIEKTYDFSPAKETVDAAVDEISKRNEFSPVQDYLESLEWDGTPRIDRLWTGYFGAENTQWHRMTAAKFLIGAVSRALPSRDGEPSKVDTMPVLEGPQGMKKSSACDALFGGTRWFSDSYLPIGSTDAIQQLDGVWCQEFADLHSFTNTNINLLKAFLTSRSDNIRRSYARRAEKEGRRCVFIGTTNDSTYLKDQTGGRRFWPIKCGHIDLEAIRRDRDQLWAEAVVRFRNGERHWFELAEENAIATSEQAERTESDPWEDIIEDFAARAQKTALTMHDVMTLLEIKPDKQDRSLAVRVGVVLKKLGYVRKRQGGGSRGWYYVKEQ